jgi:hypothetical protein
LVPSKRTSWDGLRQAAAVNPGDKFELVFRNLLEKLFVERMDQNEEIFVRYMNDAPFQKIVTTWMASEAYRRLRRRVCLSQPVDTSLDLHEKLCVAAGVPDSMLRKKRSSPMDLQRSVHVGRLEHGREIPVGDGLLDSANGVPIIHARILDHGDPWRLG